MTALWLEPAPRPVRPAGRADAPDLRLIGARPADRADEYAPPGPGEPFDLRLVEAPRHGARSTLRRGPSAAVRRRRTLLATMGLLLVGLALPLSGTGGNSHATGSALAETGHPVTYTVRPGDTLWTIAERVDPSADPRPLVARLAAQTGSDNVVPGERIVVP
jgi:nucleoid-associated protein YgaU